MSIIEKAVGKADEKPKAGARQARTSADTATGDVGDAERQRDSTRPVVSTRHLAMVGPSAEMHHPELEQDFKFLKRPLLSRIFGVSGGNGVPGHLVLVTSDAPGAGKSFISVNLAASIAQEQLTKVILIDADPLRRNLSVALKQGSRPGLLEIIADSSIVPEAVALDTDVPSLRFLPAGQCIVLFRFHTRPQ